MARGFAKGRNIRLGFAKKINAIAEPSTFELTNFAIEPSKTELLTFSPIESQAIIQLELFKPTEPIEISDVSVRPIEYGLIDLLAEDYSALLPPTIESIFEPIRRPGVAGKSYQDIDQESKQVQSSPANRKGKADLGIRCRHGLPKILCQICKESDQRAKQRVTQIFDVFEQLRFILQPPILERIGQPDVFPGGRKPYEFQITGVRWLLEKSAGLLADEMGLGKTIQAIIAIRVLFRRGHVTRVLVVCPKSVANSWHREFRAWAPELQPLRVNGSAQSRAEQWRTPAEIYIVTYETLSQDITNMPTRNFDLCIIDEAQKIKNSGTKNARSVRQIEARIRWALTGTPLENKLEDTISIFRFVKPGLFASKSDPSISQLKQAIQPFVLRRTKSQVDVQLPEITHHEYWLELTESQRSEYDAAEKDGVGGLKRLGTNATRVHVLALISRLKQICNIAEISKESTKLEFLIDQLEDLTANGEKALVFSQYPNVTLAQIKPDLEQFKPMLFDGSLSERNRIRYVDEFQEEDTHQVLLMSVGSGGTGITLTRANHVFHFDHWWNPAVVDQASMRVHRIGQQRAVFINSLFTTGTIEERIANLLKQKRDLFRGVFGELEDTEATGPLSDDDLFGLFDLPIPGRDDSSSYVQMSPVEFEHLVQRLFSALSYNVSVTKRSHDGGIDLDGTSQDLGGGRIVVQCKRYAGSVSVAVVRELLGVVSSDSRITQGFLVTTGTITRAATDFAQGQPLRLIDGRELEMLLRRHEIDVSY